MTTTVATTMTTWTTSRTTPRRSPGRPVASYSRRADARPPAMRILLIEDNEGIRSAIRRALGRRGHEILEAESVSTGRAALTEDVEAVILDVNLPDGSGFDLCRSLRNDGVRTPILMLTARDAVPDRVEGLDAGADDYLVKPFATAELDARLRAISRRALDAAPNDETLEVGDLRLDMESLVATRGSRTLDLTRTEWLLLELFARNPNRVLTREVILDRVWGMDAQTSTNGVEVYIGYLRRKLEAEGETRVIETVRGVGYVLRPTP
jgi:two-component system response regulator MprA